MTVRRLPVTSQPPGQVGILVPDLLRQMASWSTLLGRDDWLVCTYGPDNLKNATYLGQPANFGMRLAMIGSAPQIELIEPLAGPSIYTDWIAERGYGLHHIGFYVPTIADAVDEARAAGFDAIQTASGYGLHGDGGFAYFDTTAQLDVITELIEIPAMRRPNEYPTLNMEGTMR